MTFLEQAQVYVELVFRSEKMDDIEWEAYEAMWHSINPEMTHEHLAEIIERELVQNGTTFEELVANMKASLIEERKKINSIYL